MKAILVLISDMYKENLISTSFVEKILQDVVDLLYCDFIIFITKIFIKGEHRSSKKIR